MTPTAEDAKKYCPLNSLSRGELQESLCREYHEEVGTCALDHEKCCFQKCTTLAHIMKLEAGRDTP